MLSECYLFTGVGSNDLITVGVFDSPGLTRGDDSDEGLTHSLLTR